MAVSDLMSRGPWRAARSRPDRLLSSNPNDTGSRGAPARGGLDDTDGCVELGELFAIPAAVAVQNARVLDETRRFPPRLRTAPTSG